MEELLEERKRLINKLIDYMIENRYKDEDLFVTLKAQEMVKEKQNTYNINNLKKMAKKSKEYGDFFDNIEVVNVKISDTCCLTQKKIKDRWVGQCGHVMERSAVLNYLEKNKKANCPVIGCNADLKERKN